MGYFTIIDFLILPFVLMIVYSIAYRVRNHYYSHKHPFRKYFVVALTVKIIGSVGVGLFLYYYYGYGDTFSFYNDGMILNKAFYDSPLKWLNLFFHTADVNDYKYTLYINEIYYYNDISSYTAVRAISIFGLFTGNSYLLIAVLFAIFSFSGIWALFITFAEIYNEYLDKVAIGILFIPSVALWGSAVLKDTLSLTALGWLTYSLFNIFIKKQHSKKLYFIGLCSFYLAFLVKPYIIIAFFPPLLYWILFLYIEKIKIIAIRKLVKIITGVLIIVFIVVTYIMSENLLGAYSINSIFDTAVTTRSWIIYSSGEKGAYYDLGRIENISDAILLIPSSINVTLFRPYIWEAKKPIVLLSALESSIFLFLTLKLIAVVGIRKIIITFRNDPTLRFSLIFVMIFAIAVGISTGNFGTLSRYKIPCMPFFALIIIITYYKNMPRSKPLLAKLI